MNKIKEEIKTYAKILFVFLVVVSLADSYILRVKDTEQPLVIHALEAQEGEEDVQIVEYIDKEKIVPYLITESLPSDYSHKKEMVLMYLRSLGASEDDILVWDKVITHESDYNLDALPPTWVKHCQGANGAYAKELWDYGNGIKWQYECSFEGATEIKQEQSFGLFQILPSTWEGHGCEGDQTNWMDQSRCAVKIKNQSGFTQWSTYFL